MLTDDDEKRIERIVERVVIAVLEACGIKKLPSAAALRMRRMREQKRNKPENKSVTRKGRERNKGVTAPRTPAPSATTWEAYATAYRSRYGVDPTRNATVNGQLAQFVARVPAAEAPEIAAFYVRHNRAFYVSARHAVGALLRDAEGLRTEWLSGRTVTETEARQSDRTAALGNAFHELIEESENARH